MSVDIQEFSTADRHAHDSLVLKYAEARGADVYTMIALRMQNRLRGELLDPAKRASAVGQLKSYAEDNPKHVESADSLRLELTTVVGLAQDKDPYKPHVLTSYDILEGSLIIEAAKLTSDPEEQDEFIRYMVERSRKLFGLSEFATAASIAFANTGNPDMVESMSETSRKLKSLASFATAMYTVEAQERIHIDPETNDVTTSLSKDTLRLLRETDLDARDRDAGTLGYKLDWVEL